MWGGTAHPGGGGGGGWSGGGGEDQCGQNCRNLVIEKVFLLRNA